MAAVVICEQEKRATHVGEHLIGGRACGIVSSSSAAPLLGRESFPLSIKEANQGSPGQPASVRGPGRRRTRPGKGEHAVAAFPAVVPARPSRAIRSGSGFACVHSPAGTRRAPRLFSTLAWPFWPAPRSRSAASNEIGFRGPSA